MQKSKVPIFIKKYGGRHAGSAPFRIPNPAFCIGLVDVDGGFHTFTIEVSHIVGLQVDLDVVKIILPFILDFLVVSRVVKPRRIFGLVIVVGYESHVEDSTVPARQCGLV